MQRELEMAIQEKQLHRFYGPGTQGAHMLPAIAARAAQQFDRLCQAWGIQKEIANDIVRDDDGIELRFMNEDLPPQQISGITSEQQVEQLLASKRYKGLTPFGTGLRRPAFPAMAAKHTNSMGGLNDQDYRDIWNTYPVEITPPLAELFPQEYHHLERLTWLTAVELECESRSLAKEQMLLQAGRLLRAALRSSFLGHEAGDAPNNLDAQGSSAHRNTPTTHSGQRSYYDSLAVHLERRQVDRVCSALLRDEGVWVWNNDGSCELQNAAGAPFVARSAPRNRLEPPSYLLYSLVLHLHERPPAPGCALYKAKKPSEYEKQHQNYGAHWLSPPELSILAKSLFRWLQLMAINLPPLAPFALFAAVQCVSAAPTGSPPESNTAVFLGSWHEIKTNALQIGTGFAAFIALLNIGRIAFCRPCSVPKLSGDIAIGLGLLIWILSATTPGEEQLSSLLISLWILTESNYVSQMCCMVSSGRKYLWGSIGTGLAVSMFMAALQGDAWPTLSKTIHAGLPSCGFFISCAARLMPNLLYSAQQGLSV